MSGKAVAPPAMKAEPAEAWVLRPEVEIGAAGCRFQFWAADDPDTAQQKWCTVHETPAHAHEVRCWGNPIPRADPERRSATRRDRALPEDSDDSVLMAAITRAYYLETELALIRRRITSVFTGKYMPAPAAVLAKLHPKETEIQAEMKRQGRLR